MGAELLENKIYHFAQKFLIHGTKIEAEIKLIREWKSLGKNAESDLFITRYILMYNFHFLYGFAKNKNLGNYVLKKSKNLN